MDNGASGKIEIGMKHALLLLGFALILLGLYLGFLTFRTVGLYNEFGVAVPITAYALPLITIGFGTLLWVVYMVRKFAERIIIALLLLGSFLLFGLLAYFLLGGYIGIK